MLNKEEIMKLGTLDDLFQAWKCEHDQEDKSKGTFPKLKKTHTHDEKTDTPDKENPPPKFKDSFCPDGVTSLKGGVVENGTVDVLFILKESNLSEKLHNPDETNWKETHSFWFNEPDEDKAKMKYRDRIKMVLEKLGKDTNANFGYMNLNKRGGYGSTNNTSLRRYTKEYNEFIYQQIRILEPSIVVCCGCFDMVVHHVLNTHDHSLKIWKNTNKQMQPFQYTKINGETKTAKLYYCYHPSVSQKRFENSIEYM